MIALKVKAIQEVMKDSSTPTHPFTGIIAIITTLLLDVKVAKEYEEPPRFQKLEKT